jgi:hypothetical protein
MLFPLTFPISALPDWSIDGIIAHLKYYGLNPRVCDSFYTCSCITLSIANESHCPVVVPMHANDTHNHYKCYAHPGWRMCCVVGTV